MKKLSAHELKKTMVPLSDIIIKTAMELGITKLRKEFMDLKTDITKRVQSGELLGQYGKEVWVDRIALREYINKRKKECNIIHNTFGIHDLKDLLDKWNAAGLSSEEQILLLSNRLKNID